MVRQKYQGICTSFIIFCQPYYTHQIFIPCTFVVLDIFELVLTNLAWLALKLVGNFQHLINRLANFKTSWLALKYIGYLALNVYNQNLTYVYMACIQYMLGTNNGFVVHEMDLCSASYIYVQTYRSYIYLCTDNLMVWCLHITRCAQVDALL